MLLSPQRGIVYGPVRSRRLGCSLGINLLPAGGKLCNFNCCYCQYGWTDRALLASLAEPAFPTPAQVVAAIADRLESLAGPPDYLTFSGNGEPTLHPRFGEIVEAVKNLRDLSAPGARTAILSNSSGVIDAEIRRALDMCDEPIMKLDAGGEATFRRFNGPGADLPLGDVVRGLRDLRSPILQSLFAEGPAGNLGDADLDDWTAMVAAIRPRRAQVYTLDRDYPSGQIAPAPRRRLEEVCARLAVFGIPVDLF